MARWADSNQAGPEAPIVSGDLRTARINEAFAVAASDGYLTISISAPLWQASSSAAPLRRNRELRNGARKTLLQSTNPISCLLLLRYMHA